MSFFLKYKKDLFAFSFFLTLVLIFFARFLTGEQVIAFKDLSRYFYPLRYLMVGEVRSGHLPLWNPYIFCGFPLLATLQACFFYPLTLIYYLLPFNLAFNWYIILHYFLAACFMYALLRYFRLGWYASFFGGLVFAFSGYLLSVSNMNTSLSSVIWLPLVMLMWDKLIQPSPAGDKPAPLSQRERVGNMIGFVFLISLMFLGGEPTILYVTLWLLFFYTLVFAGDKLKSIAVLAGAALLSLGLVAVQLVPFIELSRLSDRVVRTSFDLVSFRSFPPRELLTFIFPYFFGNAAQFGGYTETLLGPNYQDWLISPYLGVLPLILILFAKRNKLAVFLWSAAGAALLLAFGRYTPLYRLVYSFIPGFAMIRYPVKYLFLTTFCLSFLAALGFERSLSFLGEQKERYKRPVLILAPVFVVLLGLSLIAQFFSAGIISFFSQMYSAKVPPVFFEILGGIIKFNLQSFYNLTSFVFIFCVLLAAAYWGRISKRVLAFALIGLAAADLLANGTSVMVPAPAQVFAAVPPNYTFLLKERGLNRFFYTPKLADANRTIAGESFGAALWNAKDNFTANWPVAYQLFDFSGYESILPYKIDNYYREAFGPDKLKANLGRLSANNVGYIVSDEPLKLPGLKLLRRKYQYGRSVYLYENRRVRPRAYLLSGRGEATFEFYRPGYMLMNTSSAKPARLFLSEAYYPGWRALVDSKETKILEAKEFFQAIDLPAGRHRVEFAYDPWSLKLGAGISIVCILFLGFLLFRGWGGQRESNP